MLWLASVELAQAQFINQQVGGVSIDAQGIVRKVRIDELGELQRVRQQAFEQVPGDMRQATPLRKVSLRALEAAIAAHREAGTPIPDDIRYLAGLQRIQYVFVYPEQNDVVIAGPAEGWRISPEGEIVGETTNQPVMLLDDLLVALRAIEAIRQTGISCSIDATPEGLARYQTLLKSLGSVGNNPQPAMQAIEQSLGPQMVTITGVPANSHFGRVLIAADYRMKRLAMGFEEPPIADLPNYMHMIKTSRARGSAMQRWWLAPDYDALVADPDGMAWELRKAGVKALTEDEIVDAAGGRTRTGRSDFLAKKWADNFTAHYEELSAKDAVFGQLRNCMDLAVVAALVAQENLPEKCGWNMSLLLNPDLPVESYHTPRQVDTQSTVVQKGRDWVVSASGGVQINPWQFVEAPQPDPKVGETRAKSAARTANWWWN